MKYFSNRSLKTYHTFAAHALVRHLYECEDEIELLDLFRENNRLSESLLVVGSGSNILFSGNFEGNIIAMRNKGIKITETRRNSVIVQAAAGELWDDFVAFCVRNGFYGAENLSYIPGTVGAAPVQNIGAYGAEAEQIIETVYAFDIEGLEFCSFTHEECKFGYRNSFFKNEGKNRYIITKVDFILKNQAELNLEYGSIAQEAKKYGELNLSVMRKIIINIRKAKLPEPEDLPNAGSFFKNPIVDLEIYQKLKKDYPNLVFYEITSKRVKLAAGQLIDMSGMKGYRDRRAGVHDKQALVLVNHNGASGRDILALAEKLKQTVYAQFGIMLEPEVQIF